jgi:hypothetical protein
MNEITFPNEDHQYRHSREVMYANYDRNKDFVKFVRLVPFT